MKALARRVVESNWFQRAIITLIIINGIVVGLETSPEINERFGVVLHLINQAILLVFVIEVVLKLTAVWPRVSDYFRDGWNVFDFLIVAVSLIPATGEFATVARLLRLLRVMRLVSTIPELRLIVTTLVRSIPSMGHVVILMSLLFYVYGISGYHLFHDVDPTHWRSLGISLLTLFRIVTLEDWTDVMYAAMAAYPWAWIYFVSFVVTGTFVVVNLFIAVVLNNLEESKAEALAALQPPLSRDELLKEMRATQSALAKLQERMERFEDRPN
ncbi:MAG: ion transporter [Gammaproteobacteria bacterium]|nr:ion transporter [Gammaproteobacteria bacterium]